MSPLAEIPAHPCPRCGLMVDNDRKHRPLCKMDGKFSDAHWITARREMELRGTPGGFVNLVDLVVICSDKIKDRRVFSKEFFKVALHEWAHSLGYSHEEGREFERHFEQMWERVFQ